MSTEQTAIATTEDQSLEQVSLLEEIVQATRLKPADEAYSITRKGVEALITQLLEPGKENEKVSKAGLDDMIAEIDRKLSLQLDEILHNAEFQKLESTWRSLQFLVDRVDFRENVKVRGCPGSG
jgi:type VI secretion system protein ImpC